MSVFRGAALYASGNLLSKALFFFIVPVVSAKLGARQYGIFSSIETLFSLLPAIMTLSIEVGIFRMYYDYRDEQSRRRYLGTISLCISIVSVLSAIMLLSFPKLTHWLFPQIAFNPFFILAICIGLMNALLSVPKVILQVEERALDFSLITLVQAVATISAVLLMVVWLNGGAIGYLYSVLGVNAVLVPVSYFLIRKSLSCALDISSLLSSLKFSLPMMPSIVFSWILNASDRAIMGQYLSNDQVGIYSLGWKYATLATLAISSINTAMAPAFYRIMNSGSSDSREKVSRILEVAMFVMIAICYFNSVIGFDAVRFFSKVEFSNAASIVMILCAVSAISALGFSFNLQFYQSKLSYIPVVFIVCAGLVSMISNYMLVPKIGIFSPPIALAIVNVFLFVVSYFVAQKVCPIPFKWLRIFSFAFILSALRCGVFFFLSGFAAIAANYSIILLLIGLGFALYKKGHLNVESI